MKRREDWRVSTISSRTTSLWAALLGHDYFRLGRWGGVDSSVEKVSALADPVRMCYLGDQGLKWRSKGVFERWNEVEISR